MNSKSIRKQSRREAMHEDLMLYGGKILNSEEMQRAFTQKHHTLSSVGAHTMRVAMTSLAICYALKKLHIKTDIS